MNKLAVKNILKQYNEIFDQIAEIADKVAMINNIRLTDFELMDVFYDEKTEEFTAWYQEYHYGSTYDENIYVPLDYLFDANWEEKETERVRLERIEKEKKEKEKKKAEQERIKEKQYQQYLKLKEKFEDEER